MFRKIIFGLLLFLSNSPFLFSQFTVYNSGNSPLPDNNVQSIAVDRFGKKWIGTDIGLAVFNDTNWTIYNTGNSGLPNDGVRSIAFDKNDVAWIGTYFGGLAKFNGTTWTVYNMSNSGLPNDFVKAIDFDSLGNVWVGTGYGFARFDGVTWTTWNSSNSIFVSDNILALKINRKTEFKYIGTNNGGYGELDNMDNITIYTNGNSNLVDNTQQAISLDTSGYQSLGLAADGMMIHYTGNVWQWYYNLNSGIPSNTVYDICTDSLNSKYIGSLAGLTKFDGTTWTTWSTFNSNIPNDFVHKVALERNQIIWIGTPSGAAKMVLPVGMNEFENDNSSINIYPNPNDGHFTIQWNDKFSEFKNIRVMDLAGREIFSSSDLGHGERSRTIDIGLAPGMYFVSVGNFQKKMVVR